MSKEKQIETLKDFFKSGVKISELSEISLLKPDDLFGIDSVSANKLRDNGIKSLQDLANLSEDNLPQIRDVLPQILLKWVKIAKIIEKTVKEQMKEQKKLLLIGLDNGGKTSILSVLQDKFSIIKDLLPTRGVKREKLDFFGYPIISWDLGGQVQYREKLYFNKPELFFGDVDIVLYVVDIQDSERFTETANYFKSILDILSDLNENPPFLVVLNKSDSDVRRTLGWRKNVDSIKNKFNLIADTFQNIKIDYLDTTIFDKTTVMSMFSTALIRISETSEIVENILDDFATQIDARALSLISMDGLIFGSAFKKKTDDIVLNNSALLLQTLSNFHNSVGLLREKSISLELPANSVFIRGEKLFEYSELDIPVYLWLLSEKPERFTEKIEFFRTQLLPLINLFI